MMRTVYRRKEIETITRTITYPKPVSEPLNDGDAYWTVATGGVFEDKWRDSKSDNVRLELDIIHLTKENAQAHWGAIFGGKNA